jgi:hypothetical protein
VHIQGGDGQNASTANGVVCTGSLILTCGAGSGKGHGYDVHVDVGRLVLPWGGDVNFRKKVNIQNWSFLAKFAEEAQMKKYD